MKSKFQSIITVLLCIVMILPFTSCGIEEKTGKTTESNIKNGTDSSDTNKDLPDAKYDDYEFTFLNVDSTAIYWQTNTINVEDLNADKIEAEIYKRNRFIEDEYDIVIKEVTDKDPVNKAKNVILTNDYAYDVLVLRADLMTPLISIDGLVEWSELPYVDLSQNWWSQDIQRDLSIGGKTYFTSGDISLTSYDCTSMFTFNKKLVEDNNLGNLYQLVRDGKWTMDKFSEMMTQVAKDVNNDGKYSYNDDIFGIYSYNGLYTELIAASDVRFISKDENDYPVLTANSDKFTDVYLKILNIINSNNVFCNINLSQYSEGAGKVTKFTEGEALFLSDVLFWISKMTDMEADYGILPNPKYDESQEKYISSINPTATVLSVPNISSDLERTSIILEAMAIHSHMNMIPTYYNEIVTIKNVRDEESREMINLAFENRIMELGSVYNMGGIFTTVKAYMASNKDTISSLTQRLLPSVNSKITEIINTYENQE